MTPGETKTRKPALPPETPSGVSAARVHRKTCSALYVQAMQGDYEEALKQAEAAMIATTSPAAYLLRSAPRF